MELGLSPGIHTCPSVKGIWAVTLQWSPGLLPGYTATSFYQGLTRAVKPIFDNLPQKHLLHRPSEESPQKNPFIKNSYSWDDSTVFFHQLPVVANADSMIRKALSFSKRSFMPPLIDWYLAALGVPPYPYQQRLADSP